MIRYFSRHQRIDHRLAVLAMSLLSAALQASAGGSFARAESPIDYEPLRQEFARKVAAELAREEVPGFSVAWVVDGRVVHAAGYGRANARIGAEATPDTLYRAGSISKLFNAVAAMQLVEKGQLKLDAPIEQALPDFQIQVPFADAAPITIQQLLCHRSGMIREAPVGGYLDPNQPTIAATVDSVAGCALVNPPNTKMRYSNVGPTIVGRAVEVATGMSYADYQQQHLLSPLGMTSSTWMMNDSLRPRLAQGWMRVARGDGGYRFQPAPEFELGTIPAGNLYTSAKDLAQFAVFMMNDGKAPNGQRLIEAATFNTMVTPQLTPDATGFGLGFSVNRYRDFKTAQHNGAVYGFSTSLVVLLDAKIGVVVLSNADICSAPVKRLTDASLDLLLQAVRGLAPPQPSGTTELAVDALAPMTGEYESGSHWAQLRVEGKSLVGDISGQPITLEPTGELTFLANGRMMNRAPLTFERSSEGKVVAFTALGQRFSRVDPAHSPAAPAAWQAFVGSYGPAFIPLVVSIKHGHLYATVENEYDYRITAENRFTFHLSPGMYSDEEVVFQTDDQGRVLGVVMANMYLPRWSSATAR